MSDDAMSFSKFAFITSAQTIALAELIAHPQEVMAVEVMVVTSQAYACADRLPAGYSPTQAAMELVYEFLHRYRDDEVGGPEHSRPSWLPERDNWDPSGEIEEFVDGEYHPENPYCRGLPGDKSVDLNILAALRDQPEQRYHELAEAVGISETSLRTKLDELTVKGYVAGKGRPVRWSLSKNLIDELEHMPKPMVSKSRAPPKR